MCTNNLDMSQALAQRVLTFPIHTIANQRRTAGMLALGAGKGDKKPVILTENLHATTNDGLYSSATAVFPAGSSAVQLGGEQFVGLLGGALAAIGSAVLPTLVNVGIDLVKKVISDDERDTLPFEPATVASVDAVMRLGDPGNPDKLYEIGRFGFECTPNSVIASETPTSTTTTSGLVLPESFGSLAACLLAEAGNTLFELLRNNVGLLTGFDKVAFQQFLNAVLAQSGSATVELIQKAVNNCLMAK